MQCPPSGEPSAAALAAAPRPAPLQQPGLSRESNRLEEYTYTTLLSNAAGMRPTSSCAPAKSHGACEGPHVRRRRRRGARWGRGCFRSILNSTARGISSSRAHKMARSRSRRPLVAAVLLTAHGLCCCAAPAALHLAGKCWSGANVRRVRVRALSLGARADWPAARRRRQVRAACEPCRLINS